MVSPRSSIATSVAIFFARPADVLMLCGRANASAKRFCSSEGPGTSCAPAGSPRWRREGHRGWWLRWRCEWGHTRLPATIRPGGVDVPLAVPGHAARRSQPGDVFAVDLAPDALRFAAGVPLQERTLVECLPDAVYPPPAQCHVDESRQGRYEPDLEFDIRTLDDLAGRRSARSVRPRRNRSR